MIVIILKCSSFFAVGTVFRTSSQGNILISLFPGTLLGLFFFLFFGALHLQLAAVDSTGLQLQAKVVRNGKAGRT